MSDEPVKICPQCGEEYAPEALNCADCGGALVFRSRYKKPVEPLEQNEATAFVRQSQINHLRELAGLLQKKGIRSDIRFQSCPPGT